MVGQGFVQIVAQIPPHAQPVGDQAHEVAFGANAFEEHHQLQLEEDHRINAGAPVRRHSTPAPLTDKREVEHPLQVAIEVVSRNQFL